MIDVMPLLKHMFDCDSQMSDVKTLLAQGFAQAVIDHCLEQKFLRMHMCNVVSLTAEGTDQVVFDAIEGVPC